MHTSSNALKKTSKSSVNNKIRKFVMKYSSGLRIRTHPTLQSEQIGLVPVDGIITFIDEVSGHFVDTMHGVIRGVFF